MPDMKLHCSIICHANVATNLTLVGKGLLYFGHSFHLFNSPGVQADVMDCIRKSQMTTAAARVESSSRARGFAGL